MLPALKSAYEAGVKTVPYRVNPGGTDGTDYDVWVGADFVTDGKNWGNWIIKNVPGRRQHPVPVAARKGNSQGIDELKGLKSVLDPTGKYTFIGESPFEVTNWDPAKTQQVLTAAIAKYPKIDVIVSDFGPSLVGALPEFEKSGRSIPALVTSDGNVALAASTRRTRPRTRTSSCSRSRPATTTPASRSSGPWRWRPAAPRRPTSPSRRPAFEDSVTARPNPVTCKSDLPGDIYLSAQMSGEDQASAPEVDPRHGGPPAAPSPAPRSPRHLARHGSSRRGQHGG